MFGPTWFQPRPRTTHDLRARRAVPETQTRTLRRFNAPLVFLRRRANQIGVVPEVWEAITTQ